MNSEPKTVLLVEDEPLLAELMTDALTDRGFAVVASVNASAALRHLMSGERCDVLFTDIDLGEGMDGATLARLARDMRAGLPVVYTSGRRPLNESQMVPGAVFLTKPYSLDHVVATLAQKIGEDAESSYSAMPPRARNCSSQ